MLPKVWKHRLVKRLLFLPCKIIVMNEVKWNIILMQLTMLVVHQLFVKTDMLETNYNRLP